MRVIARTIVDLPNGTATSVVLTSGVQETDSIVVSPIAPTNKATVFRGVYVSATEIAIISSDKTVAGDKVLVMVLRNE